MKIEFEKGIDELKRMKLSEAEKTAMLSHIVAQPVASPYARHVRVYAHVRKLSPVMALCLVAVFASGTLAYAGERALPGEKFYAIKTKVVEPLRGLLAITQEQKLEWEQAKVSRRLSEAERLSESHELSDEKTEALEKAIEKSSSGFAAAAEKVSAQKATTTEGKMEREERLKQDFKEKLDDKRDKNTPQVQDERIKRLKDKAVETLERKNSDKERGKGE